MIRSESVWKCGIKRFNYGNQTTSAKQTSANIPAQNLFITCFHSSFELSLLKDSEDAVGVMSFSDLLKLKMDCFLLWNSSSSPTVNLIRSEKSCSERFWKLSRAPRGLGNVREVRRWEILLLDEPSSSMSESMDVPVDLWCFFFGGLSAETYWEKQAGAVISGIKQLIKIKTSVGVSVFGWVSIKEFITAALICPHIVPVQSSKDAEVCDVRDPSMEYQHLLVDHRC